MKFDKKEIFLLIIILLMFVIAFYTYPMLPDVVPIHWNAAGEIDSYGSKFIGLFLLPIITLILYIFISIIPIIGVFKENINKFIKHIFGIKSAFVLFMFFVYIMTLLPNFGYKFNMTNAILPAMAILFYYIGYMFKFAKRNFFIGIRTPWTLANENVWNKTHQLGSVLFKIMAFIFLIVIFVPSYATYLLLISLLLVIISLFIYSFLLYQKEIELTERKIVKRISKKNKKR